MKENYINPHANSSTMAELYKFNVGNKEKHKIAIDKNWWWGSIGLNVDGNEVKRQIAWVGGTKEIVYEVGKTEKHNIKVIIEVPKLLAIITPWKYEISVDGKKLKSFSK